MQKFIVVGFLIAICFVAKNHGSITAAQKSLIQGQLFTAGLDCVKDHPLSLSDIKAFKKGMVPDNSNSKCFSACMFKKTGVMDGMGKITPDGALENAQKIFKGNEEHLKNIAAIMEKCSEVNEKDTKDGDKGCERAKLAFECLNENASKYGLDIDL